MHDRAESTPGTDERHKGPPHLRTGAEPEVSVVVPAYNEASVLAESMSDLTHWLERSEWRWELILVDDGSTDGSREIMAAMARRQPRVTVIHGAPNQGRGWALRQGMTAARGDVVLTTEADGSWEETCLHELIHCIREGRADIAVASPYRAGGGVVGVPRGRRLLSRTANLLASRLVGGQMTMVTGMTRAYRRSVVDRVMSGRNDKGFHLDVLCRAQRHRLVVHEVAARLEWVTDRRRRRTGSPWLLASQIVGHCQVLASHLLRRFDP
jgi:dolichol-phosphate mannosyltransferase